MDKLKMMSRDKVQGNVEKIRALFPNAVTEVLRDGKPTLAVDFDVLKQELADTLIDDREQRYQFTWPDKQKSILLANTPISATLRPCKEESVDFDNTQNIYIEGDNLEVLKLLQETYLGKIKMIYIDPPYNTGNDFVYNDDFSMSAQEYAEVNGEFDEEGNRLFRNTESNGRFHTDWLNMIYPRLRLAKDFLSDDGAIFISIDDNEADNLRKICNEVFGENNFVAQFVWKKKTGAGKAVSNVFSEHEYILCYSKDSSNLPVWRIESDEDGTFINPDNDSKGSWESCALTAPSKNRNPNQLYMIEIFYNNTNTEIVEVDDLGRKLFDSFLYGNNTVALRTCREEEIGLSEYDTQLNRAKFVRRWAYSKQNIKQVFFSNRVYLKVGNIPRYKKYQFEYVGKAISSIYYNEFSTQQGTDGLRKLFSEHSNLLDYPKPLPLMRHLIKFATKNEDIILDFFSGSATTADAVMQLNAEDGGNRKFIMVQLPEPCDEKSEAYKAGYKNICEIGKERIRRAGKKIKDENGERAQDLDVGFRVLKLDSSNMKDVYYKPEEYSQIMLGDMQDNIKPDRTALDLLFQVMLELGKPLSAKITQKVIAGKSVYNVDDGDLVACFEDNITAEIVTEIAKAKPLYAVFRDSGLSSDSVAANFEQIFATYSPNTKRKVL